MGMEGQGRDMGRDALATHHELKRVAVGGMAAGHVAHGDGPVYRRPEAA